MLRENVPGLDWCLFRTITLWFLGPKPKRYSHYPINSRCHDFASHLLGKRKLSFALEGRLTLKNKREAGTKVLASQLSLDWRSRRSGWVASTTLISSAFTALLNCAEVGRRNRILTNYRFLSHSLFLGRYIKSFESTHLSLATELSVTGSFYIASSMVQ